MTVDGEDGLDDDTHIVRNIDKDGVPLVERKRTGSRNEVRSGESQWKATERT